MVEIKMLNEVLAARANKPYKKPAKKSKISYLRK